MLDPGSWTAGKKIATVPPLLKGLAEVVIVFETSKAVGLEDRFMIRSYKGFGNSSTSPRRREGQHSRSVNVRHWGYRCRQIGTHVNRGTIGCDDRRQDSMDLVQPSSRCFSKGRDRRRLRRQETRCHHHSMWSTLLI
jgi:hypothetical protein